MALDKSTCLKFYKRKDIQQAMVEHAQHKEVSVRYNDSFGKRPDVLMYPKEVIELALKGVTSFHCSEELWESPLALGGSQTKKELDELRTGWDLVLDIDCKFIDYSKICADLIIKFLKQCEVKDISVKFSGNKGFHIGVPFEAFPSQVGNALTKDLFPEAARKIAFYIKENIKNELGKRMLAFDDFSRIKEKVGLASEDIIEYEKNQYGDKVAKLNVEKFLEIDTVLISSRHLYRMPYSLHEKSGLASLPLDPDKVIEFERSMAEPDKILMPMFTFLERNVTSGSARRLLMQALDFEVKEERPKLGKKNEKSGKYAAAEEIVIQSPIKEELFPLCMKLILNGLEDGKKRGVFCLSGFLGKIGWNRKEIEDYILAWNKEKNKQPLRDNYIISQLRYYNPGEKLPPNCDNDSYYKGIGVCQPDNFCSRIKNPVNYTILKWKDYLKRKEEDGQQQAKELKRQQNELKKQEKELKRVEKEKKKEVVQ